jgi:hypothetical protein
VGDLNLDIRKHNEQIAQVEASIDKMLKEAEGKYLSVYYLVRQSADKIREQKELIEKKKIEEQLSSQLY